MPGGPKPMEQSKFHYTGRTRRKVVPEKGTVVSAIPWLTVDDAGVCELEAGLYEWVKGYPDAKCRRRITGRERPEKFSSSQDPLKKLPARHGQQASRVTRGVV